MDGTDQEREEHHFRQVETIMLLLDEACRKAERAAEELRRDGAAPHLISALETAAAASRAERKRMMRSVYWRAPTRDSQESLIPDDGDAEERLAG